MKKKLEILRKAYTRINLVYWILSDKAFYDNKNIGKCLTKIEKLENLLLDEITFYES